MSRPQHRQQCSSLLGGASGFGDDFNADKGLASGDDWASLDDQQVDLRVVAVEAAVLERIEQGFLHVVQISPPAIGRADRDVHGQATGQRRIPPQPSREGRAHRLAEAPT